MMPKSAMCHAVAQAECDSDAARELYIYTERRNKKKWKTGRVSKEAKSQWRLNVKRAESRRRRREAQASKHKAPTVRTASGDEGKQRERREEEKKRRRRKKNWTNTMFDVDDWIHVKSRNRGKDSTEPFSRNEFLNKKIQFTQLATDSCFTTRGKVARWLWAEFRCRSSWCVGLSLN